MKNVLDVNIQYNSLEGLTFIQRFTNVYMFLEGIEGSGDVNCKRGGICCGCRGVRCKTPTAVNRQSTFFFLFNTMTGNSVLRRRIDGVQTEMMKLIGDINVEGIPAYGNDCGSDFTVDFLFGYAGYDYRKVTDAALFEKEVKISIDVGKPVIAKVKSGVPRHYIITGYDGNNPLCPETRFVTYRTGEGNVLAEPEVSPAYSEIESLIIVGDKAAPRYTLIDGLKNIKRVIEGNISEGVWDGFIETLNGLEKASPEERKAIAQSVSNTNIYLFNTISFTHTFKDKMKKRELFREINAPIFNGFWNKINEPCSALNGHKLDGFAGNKDWANVTSAEFPAIIKDICGTIQKYKEADTKLLEIINEAIEILDKQS